MPTRTHDEKHKPFSKNGQVTQATREVTGASVVTRPPFPAQYDSSAADAVELHSEAVQDILSQVPHWPIRWGNTLILITFVVLLSLSWFIPYTDSVSANITIMTHQPPARVVAPVSSKLAQLFVTEKQHVKRLAPLGVLENPAHYQDMHVLKRWMAVADSMMQAASNEVRLPNLPPGLKLGRVQHSYMAVQQRLLDYRSFVNDPYYAAKLSTLEAQRDEYDRLNQTFAEQRDLAVQKLVVAQQMFERNEQLYEKKILARGQFEQVQADFLQKQSDTKIVESTLADNQIRRSATEGAILDLVREHTGQERTLRLALTESFNMLKNEVTTWEQMYLLQAPIAGQVTFLKMLYEHQFVQTSEALMAIVPDSGEVIGQMYLPQARAGRVKVGQQVRITLGDYSNTEVGVVEGVIEDITLAVQDKNYLIWVRLPNGLKTSYGIHLDFRQEMQGTAEITTENQRLLLRVFNWLRFFFEESISLEHSS